MTTSPPANETIRMSTLGTTVMLRDSINSLFDRLEAGGERRLVFDFSGVEFMSRSSAHEYLVRKARSRLSISEFGVSTEVARMLSLVRRQLDHSRNGTPRRAPAWTTMPPQSV